MSRVIRIDGPGKSRSQLMRTAAELIRRLSEKSAIDNETKDMAALLVYCFREIDFGIDESVRAWEKRNYWVKAEQFRLKWSWAGQAANKLEKIVTLERWEQLPPELIKLLPYFEEIKIAQYTRKPTMWEGLYQRLMSEQAAEKGA